MLLSSLRTSSGPFHGLRTCCRHHGAVSCPGGTFLRDGARWLPRSCFLYVPAVSKVQCSRHFLSASHVPDTDTEVNKLCPHARDSHGVGTDRCAQAELWNSAKPARRAIWSKHSRDVDKEDAHSLSTCYVPAKCWAPFTSWYFPIFLRGRKYRLPWTPGEWMRLWPRALAGHPRKLAFEPDLSSVQGALVRTPFCLVSY